MLNLAKRWGKEIWKFYQKDPEGFVKKGFDPDISSGKIKADLLQWGVFESRLGFKKGRVGDYGHFH